MMRYRITVTGNAYVANTIEVDAESEDEAMDKWYNSKSDWEVIQVGDMDFEVEVLNDIKKYQVKINGWTPITHLVEVDAKSEEEAIQEVKNREIKNRNGNRYIESINEVGGVDFILIANEQIEVVS